MADATPQVLSLDQKRAAYAWVCVNVARHELRNDERDKDYDKFVSLVKSAPALIMNNGLMQFLAFCRSKLDDKKPEKERGYRLLLLAVLAWLFDEEKAKAIIQGFQSLDTDKQRHLYRHIMNSLSESRSQDYRLQTMEALELTKWLKQQADALKSFAGVKE